MRKIANLHVLLCLIFLACATPSAQNANEKQLKEKYPHSIIGEDYQLLTEKDLAISSCIASPEPFSLHKLTSHPYWQCFSTKDSAFECEESDPDESGRTAILAIVLKKGGITHEYLSRRAISLEGCKAFGAEWKRLTHNQDHVCVSGQFINPKDERPNEKDRAWIFESYKTAKGCDSYFEGGCSLDYKIKHGCDLAEMKAASP